MRFAGRTAVMIAAARVSDTDALDSRIGQMSAEITEKQDRLKADQETLSKQVRAQRLAVSAKAGSVADFSELQVLASDSEGVRGLPWARTRALP